MRRQLLVASITCMNLLASSAASAQQTTDLHQQVTDAERTFAGTMAQHDLAAFASFLSAETIFFSGSKPLHGKEEVIAWWKRFYELPDAPFSWEPEQVEVLDSGTLALTSGPVHDPKGKLVGRFTSIWRLESPGVWRIIFDKGNEVCDCAKPK